MIGSMRDSVKRARELRRASTKAETLLWAQLRDRRLGGYKFRRQRPVGRFFADFACLERMLIVELDGESHELTDAHDFSRDRRLNRDGYRVLRFTNDDVRTNLQGVLDAILNALNEAKERPTLTLSLSHCRGRGDSIETTALSESPLPLAGEG
jgi:adenine-specific DNA-methyltransferase